MGFVLVDWDVCRFLYYFWMVIFLDCLLVFFGVFLFG